MKLDVKAFAFSFAILFGGFLFILGLWHSSTGYGTITSAVVKVKGSGNLSVVKGDVVFLSQKKRKAYLAVSAVDVANRVSSLILRAVYPGLPDFEPYNPKDSWFTNFKKNIFPTILLTIYGLIDGLIFGTLFAFLYNLFVSRKEKK